MQFDDPVSNPLFPGVLGPLPHIVFVRRFQNRNIVRIRFWHRFIFDLQTRTAAVQRFVRVIGGVRDRSMLVVRFMASLANALNDFIRRENLVNRTYMWLTFQSIHLAHVYTTVRTTVNRYRTQWGVIMRTIANALNSNDTLEDSDAMSIDVTFVRPPGFTGRGRINLNTYMIRKMERRYCIVRVSEEDGLCLPRVLVVMRAFELEKQGQGATNGHDRFDYLREPTEHQFRRARELCLDAGVDPDLPFGVDSVELFQAAFDDPTGPFFCNFNISIWDADRAYSRVAGFSERCRPLVRVVVAQNHFWGCKSMATFVRDSNHCRECDHAFDGHRFFTAHSCMARACQACLDKTCTVHDRDWSQIMYCASCYRRFPGASCYLRHQANGTCERRRSCRWCGKDLKDDRPSCDCKSVCTHCKERVTVGRHECFMASPNEAEWDQEKPTLVVYADIETMQETRWHVPNLICYARENDDEVASIAGEHCLERFLEEMEALTSRHRVTVIFHNLKKFDGQLILETSYDSHRDVSNIIAVGQKVLRFSVDGVEYKDSFCFLPHKLADFTSMFGLDGNRFVKGYFPHLFNVRAHQTYRGPVPAVDYFDPEGMKSELAEFYRWHSRQVAEVGDAWDLQDELLRYCESDVRLLKEGVNAFRRLFEAEAGFDPILKCITIASACMRFFRQSLLPENTIAVEPLAGWMNRPWKEDALAKAWLARAYPTVAFNPVELENGKMRVHAIDGRTVYWYLPCLKYGCISCCGAFSHSKNAEHLGVTDVQARTALYFKLDRLRELGYETVIQWQCDDGDVDEPEYVLDPRRGFFGGRVEAICHRCEVDRTRGEEIRYVDICSLYPWVNRCCLYPVGHPREIVEPPSLHGLFGMADVTVVPPRRLMFPVLPDRLKANEHDEWKLVFHCCRTCAKAGTMAPCQHSDDERAMRGIWCTPELEKAEAVGYRFQKIHSVWHFDECRDDLFRDYVDKWLRIKTAASGWPSDDPDERRAFVERFNARHRWPLVEADVRENPGLRQLAKLMLNSFWGKFGENPNKAKTEVTGNSAYVYEAFGDPKKEIVGLEMMNEHVAELKWRLVNETVRSGASQNVFIAAFTTCHARLRLYSFLEQLDPDQPLYMDTDSLIYLWRPGKPAVPTSKGELGAMENEFKRDDRFMVDFGSTGPKSYYMEMNDGTKKIKCKGFNVKTSRALKQVNNETMYGLLLEHDFGDPRLRGTIETYEDQFVVGDQHEMRVELQIKRLAVTSTKRPLHKTHLTTYPFGY